MEQQAYLTFYSILPLRKAYGTTKVKVDEKFLQQQKDLTLVSNLLRAHKLLLRFISKDCPPLTKKFLQTEIKSFLKNNNAKLLVYYLLDEEREIVIMQNDICLIRILQNNVYIPPNVEPEEWFRQ